MNVSVRLHIGYLGTHWLPGTKVTLKSNLHPDILTQRLQTKMAPGVR